MRFIFSEKRIQKMGLMKIGSFYSQTKKFRKRLFENINFSSQFLTISMEFSDREPLSYALAFA